MNDENKELLEVDEPEEQTPAQTVPLQPGDEEPVQSGENPHRERTVDLILTPAEDGQSAEADTPQSKKQKEKKKAKEKKSKLPGKVLIGVMLFVAVVLLSAVVTTVVLKLFATPSTAEEPEPSEIGAAEESEEPEPSEEPSEEPTPTPSPTPTPTPVLTQSDAVNYLAGLSPNVLGLAGESMDEYELYSEDKVVMVSGVPCVEISVYRDDNPTGTNDIQGRYLLSRTNPRRLFLVNDEDGTAIELPLGDATVVEPAADTAAEPQDGQETTAESQDGQDAAADSAG